MSLNRRLAAALLIGTVGAGSMTATASATPRSATLQGEEEKTFAPTMLVLDASKSMEASDGDGGTKMSSAKKAVHDVVDSAPDGSHMGLAAYGNTTGTSSGEKDEGCEDVSVLHEPGQLDRSALKSSVDELEPSGFTPISKALEVANEQLPDSGPRSIVLVSDGKDTCAPPEPCDTVKELSDTGTDLVVHSVGFDVNPEERRELNCISQATGGTYTDAPDAESLENALPRVTNTALRNYRPAGTPVSGTPDVFNAPTVEPGQYLDRIGGETEHFYSVDAPDDATLYFGATVSYSPVLSNGRASVRVKVYGKDGETCSESDRNSERITDDGDVVTAQASWDTADPDAKDECRGPGQYYVSVERPSASKADEPRPVELLVGVEPSVATMPDVPPATEPVAFDEPPGQPQEATGGATFGTATTLDGSGVYTDDVHFGEYVFYRVKVDWGQSLNVRVRYDNTEGDLKGFARTRASVYNPFRKGIHTEQTNYRGDARSLEPTDQGVPVNYRNREASDDTVAAQSVAGWYYIAVKVGQPSRPSAAASNPVPVYIDVDRSGETSGTPDYQYTSDAERADGVFGEEAQQGAGGDQAGGNGSGGPAQDDSFPVAWVAGGSAAAAAVLATIGFWLFRRRRIG